MPPAGAPMERSRAIALFHFCVIELEFHIYRIRYYIFIFNIHSCMYVCICLSYVIYLIVMF